MATITFADKVGLKTNNLPAENQIRDVDINEIKSVVNANASAQTNTNGIGTWSLDTAHATTPPTTGKFNFDNGTIGSATKFRIHKTDADGRLIASILDQYKSGDIIVFLNKSTVNKLITIVLGAKTTETNYFEFVVTSISVVGTWAVDDNAFCLPTTASSGISFRGEWNPATTYDANDVVSDGAFLMLANSQTNDRPAPTKIDEPFYRLDDRPSWSTTNFTDVVRQSLKIENPPAFLTVSGLRFWLPTTDSSLFIQVHSINMQNGAYQFHGRWSGDDFGSIGWQNAFFDAITIDTDESYMFVLTTYQTLTTNALFHDYVFNSITNTDADPTSGQITVDASQGILRISVEDRNAVNQRTDLEKIFAGSNIAFIQESDPNKGNNYNILDVTDNTTWFEVRVELDLIGDSGLVEAGQNIDVIIVEPNFEEQGVKFLSNNLASISWKSGQIQTGNDAPTTNQNAYGVDVLIQQNTKSNNWDILSFNPFTNFGEIQNFITGGSSETTNTQQTISSDLNPADASIKTYYVDASSGDVEITLPSAPDDGTRWNIKKIDSTTNSVTIVSTVGRTIDGEDELTFNTPFSSFTVQYNDNSSEYFIL